MSDAAVTSVSTPVQQFETSTSTITQDNSSLINNGHDVILIAVYILLTILCIVALAVTVNKTTDTIGSTIRKLEVGMNNRQTVDSLDLLIQEAIASQDDNPTDFLLDGLRFVRENDGKAKTVAAWFRDDMNSELSLMFFFCLLVDAAIKLRNDGNRIPTFGLRQML